MMSIATDILDRAYEKLDIQYLLKAYPSRRSLTLANTGVTDGELLRGQLDSNQYPNLIKVPVPVATGRLMAFTKHADLKVQGWEGLNAYRVGSHAGINETKRHENDFKSFYEHPDIEQLFNLLDRDRLDLLILPLAIGSGALKELQLADIKMFPTPIETNELFHYLHSKHRDLIPSITQVLQEMHDSGELHPIGKNRNE